VYAVAEPKCYSNKHNKQLEQRRRHEEARMLNNTVCEVSANSERTIARVLDHAQESQLRDALTIESTQKLVEFVVASGRKPARRTDDRAHRFFSQPAFLQLYRTSLSGHPVNGAEVDGLVTYIRELINVCSKKMKHLPAGAVVQFSWHAGAGLSFQLYAVYVVFSVHFVRKLANTSCCIFLDCSRRSRCAAELCSSSGPTMPRMW
jgi:hypothetical protein